MLRLIAPIVLALVAAACGGTAASDSASTSSTSSPGPPAGDGEAPPVVLDVTVSTTSAATTPAQTDDWALGGTVTADGILAGTFDVFPMCDVRNDADGEFLNVAFGYQDLDDPAVPTVRVVTHVPGWRDQGEFKTAMEAQYETGSGAAVTFQDAMGVAEITITFVGSIGEAEVATIELWGSFDGAVNGTVRASLTCVAG